MERYCIVCGKKLTNRQKRYCSPLCKFKAPVSPNIKKKYVRRRETLCWGCDNACGGCNWSNSLKPVEGWNAIKTRIKINAETGEYTDSYFIIECPEFKREKKRLRHD